jgi:hypothetical protein
MNGGDGIYSANGCGCGWWTLCTPSPEFRAPSPEPRVPSRHGIDMSGGGLAPYTRSCTPNEILTGS